MRSESEFGVLRNAAFWERIVMGQDRLYSTPVMLFGVVEGQVV